MQLNVRLFVWRFGCVVLVRTNVAPGLMQKRTVGFFYSILFYSTLIEICHFQTDSDHLIFEQLPLELQRLYTTFFPTYSQIPLETCEQTLMWKNLRTSLLTHGAELPQRAQSTSSELKLYSILLLLPQLVILITLYACNACCMVWSMVRGKCCLVQSNFPG